MPLKVGSQVTNTPTEECQECVVIPYDLLWPIAYFYFEGEIKGITVLGKSTARIRSQTFIAIQQIFFSRNQSQFCIQLKFRSQHLSQ